MKRSGRTGKSRNTHNTIYENGMFEAGDIDPAKVLLVVDTDNAYSLELAQYYQTKRGLNTSHILSYSMGGANDVGGTDGADQATFLTNIVDPIATYILANNIQAVICSFVPYHTDYTNQVLKVATSSVLAQAVYIRDTVTFAAVNTGTQTDILLEIAWVYSTWTDGGSLDDGASSNSVYSLANVPPVGARAFQLKGWGQLGNPLNKDLAGLTEAKRMIDDASVKTSGTVHVGMHDRVTGPAAVSLTAVQSERARQACVARGVPVRHNIRTYNAGWLVQPPPASYDNTAMLAGSLDETAWGMCGSSIANEAVGAAYVNSYTWTKGSWGYEATSAGVNLMRNMLDNGACSAIGAIHEPLTTGVPLQDSFMRNLLLGYSMMGAMMLGRVKTGWMMDAWGDPLYAPFKR